MTKVYKRSSGAAFRKLITAFAGCLFSIYSNAQCCSNGVNLLANYNPDFSAPFTTVPPGFATDNTYSTTAGAGRYTIITSRNYGACGATPEFDHTTGGATGKYLWFDTPGSASAANPSIAWTPYDSSKAPGTQNLITVTPNTDYVFSVWVRDLARMNDCVSGGAPIMGLRINGVDMAQINLGLVTSPCCPQWTYLCSNWNSGTDTTALIRIESRTGSGFTDLGIDDVYFGTTLVNSKGVLGSDTTICQGDSIVLQASLPGATDLWSDGSTGTLLTVKSAGLFWVEISQNGCVGRDSINIGFTAIPTVDIGKDTTVCGQSYVLVPIVSGTAPLNYLWQDNTVGTTYPAINSGLYWLQVSNACGSARDSANVIIQSPPNAFTLGNDTAICSGNSIALTPSPVPIGTFLWQDNSSGSTLQANAAGTYWLNVSNPCGTSMDSIIITVQPALVAFTLGNDTSICEGTSVILTPAPAPTGNYVWQDNSTGNSFTAADSGVYSLTVSGNCGNVSDTLYVYKKYLPEVLASGDTVACGDSLLLYASANTPVSFVWSDGTTGPLDVVSSSNIYKVSATNECGNVSIAMEILLFRYPVPPFNRLVVDTCDKVSLLLDAKNAGMTYIWSNALNTQTITVETPGTYVVTITNNGFCPVMDSAVISQHSCAVCKMKVPTAFSPNGDGMNERFKPIFQCGVQRYSLHVYNRWGEEVFSTDDPLEGWDGIFKDTNQPVGVYVYYVQATYPSTQTTESLTGNVTLLR